MTAMTGRRRRRGSLTPEMIVTESLRLLDTEGADGFSLPKLGRALGADPTAVYRHFASKNDLVLAIADRLIEEAMADLDEQPCWLDTIEQVIRRQRASYLRHPAASSLASHRTTGRAAEMRVVNILIGAVLKAGFDGARAAVIYRAIGDFALAWAGGGAAFLSAGADRRQADRAARTRACLAVDRAEFPHVWKIRDSLAGVADDEIFETAASAFIDGLTLRAPRPGSCGAHPLPGVAS